jgi:apolipoprotein N-acyltransferase
MPFLAAIFSGCLMALSFPTIVGGVHFPNLFCLAWVSLIPYLLVLRPDRPGQVALLTLILGTFWNGLTSYWIFNALYFNGQLSLASSLGVLAFMAVGFGVILSAFITLALFLARRFYLPLFLVLPTAWTFFEWSRNYGPFGGYPWSNLGYSQAPWLTLMQSADLFGVYGITFLIVLTNVALAEFILALRRKTQIPRVPLVISAVLILGFLAYGFIRLPQIERSIKNSKTLAVGLVQPNIGPEFKWRLDLNPYIEKLLDQATHQATEEGAQFVVWPETVLPTALPLDLKEFKPLNGFSVPLLLGIISMEEIPGRTQPLIYNSALQVEPGGQFFGRQHKQHLVPLGEYVPLRKILWFVEPVAAKMGDFRTIPITDLLRVYGHPYGVTICYEDLFPEISRHFTQMGADFLINITNDAWYGDSSELEQHLNFSKFRAVENRRALIRGTNNGHTAAIDPSGHIHAEIPKFIPGVLLTEIPLGGPVSIYTRWGDALWIGLIAIALMVGFIFRYFGPSGRGHP